MISQTELNSLFEQATTLFKDEVKAIGFIKEMGGFRPGEEEQCIALQHRVAMFFGCAPTTPREPVVNNPFLKGRKFVTCATGYQFPTFKFICQAIGLYAGPPTTLIGESGGSKSALATLLALSVAAGRNFLGMDVVRGKVMWLDYEQGSDLVEAKMMRLMRGHNITEIEDGYLSFVMPTRKLSDPAAFEELCQATEGIDLAIVDCLRGSSTINENDSEARGPLDMLRLVSERTKCAFLVIHHAGKKDKEDGRGNSSLKDAVTTSLVVTKSVNSKTGQEFYKLSQTKHRLGKFPGMQYMFEDIGAYDRNIGLTEAVKIVILNGTKDDSDIQKRILKFLVDDTKLTGTELYKKVGGNKTTYQDELNELIERKSVKMTPEGNKNWYSIDVTPLSYGPTQWNDSEVEE